MIQQQMGKKRFFFTFFSDDWWDFLGFNVRSSLENLIPERPLDAIRTNDDTLSDSV